ncbi:MAG: RNA polymerase sigma factor [Myxococcales bacterium]|nr:RNA polymerase sigma factor [Myxococcales bacterium]
MPHLAFPALLSLEELRPAGRPPLTLVGVSPLRDRQARTAAEQRVETAGDRDQARTESSPRARSRSGARAGASLTAQGPRDTRGARSEPVSGRPHRGADTEADDAALRSRLSRVVARTCPSWAAAHHEDIVQAAMIRVLRVRARSGSDHALPSAYLWKVAYTATIDELRRLRAKREVPLVADEGAELVDARAPGPERRAEAAEISAAIRECLATLSDDRRRAVTLYLQGHSVPEAGRLLGWSTKRAENMVYRGLAELRGHLERKGLRP